MAETNAGFSDSLVDTKTPEVNLPTNWDWKHNQCQLSQEFRAAYIANIKGKEYVSVNGLLALGNHKGIRDIVIDIVQFPNKDNEMTAILKATVHGYSWDPVENKIVSATYSAHGDANAKNISTPAIAVHYIRMAETRALGRVLRNYTNIGMTTIEEIDSVVELPKITAVQINKISGLMKAKGVSKDEGRSKLTELTGKLDLRETTPVEADQIIQWLETK